MLVDWAWLSGKNGIVIPQRLLGVTQDGIVGPKTIEAINKLDSKTFFDQLYKARLKYIDNIIANRPANKVFKTGPSRLAMDTESARASFALRRLGTSLIFC